jgi:hypothetical protein
MDPKTESEQRTFPQPLDLLRGGTAIARLLDGRLEGLHRRLAQQQPEEGVLPHVHEGESAYSAQLLTRSLSTGLGIT